MCDITTPVVGNETDGGFDVHFKGLTMLEDEQNRERPQRLRT
jgi:hypothetical protein